MPTAVIAEDEALLAEVLREQLAQVWPDLRVVAVAADGESALRALRAHRPDVAFLDIRMPGLSGIEVARQLLADHASAPPAIVFVSAYDQYAIDAFDAAAVDYLLKPVAPERLSRCVQRLRKRLEPVPRAGQGQPAEERGAPGLQDLLLQLQARLDVTPGGITTSPGSAAGHGVQRRSHLRYIRASLGEVIRQIPVDEVLYFDAQDKYVSVVTRDATALVRTSLSELLATLDPERFAQIHRSTIVNLDAIDTIRRDITGRVFVHLRDKPGGRETKLAVSRQFAWQFKGM